MCVAEEYRVPNPVAKHHGDWKMLSGMFVRLPYLTNEKELQPGDLRTYSYCLSTVGCRRSVVKREA